MPVRWVVCDWGNTLMRDFGLPGPMAEWPEVAVLPGAAEALAALGRRYRLAVASNAEASDAVLIRRALDRGGLGRFFAAVFSSREMGVSKPDPGFFQEILKRLKAEGHETVAIGDDLLKDIRPARAAGMRTLLLDWGGWGGCAPEADGAARSWAEVPALIARMDHTRS